MAASKMIGVVLLSLVAAVTIQGRGVNVGLCGDWQMDCQCGSPGYVINIPVKQCTYFHRWKPKCKPCDDVSKESVCSKFITCAECNRDGCTRCPPNKFGQMCTSNCQCQNGAGCQQDGTCVCPADFSGRFCEVKNAPKCPAPDVPSNGQIAGSNYEQGQSITYTCLTGFTLVGINTRLCNADNRWSGDAPRCEKTCPPLTVGTNVISEDALQFKKFKCADPAYELVGSELLNCRADGTWDGPAPICSKRCAVLRNPANGQVIYSAQTLVHGTTARFHCNSDFKVSGREEIVCNDDGTWSDSSPVCEKISYCADPGTPVNGQRSIVKGVSGDFSQETVISYACSESAILVGAKTVECLTNSTWTAPAPLCTIVSDKAITCNTNGVDVFGAVNMPIRITCPSGCQRGNPQVWGTVIYKKESKLCASAIHAGMITQSGGTVDVVNNGVYTQFAGSNSNGIKSKRHRGSTESFRFEYYNEDDDDESRCPHGWIELEKHCVLFVDKVKAWESAVATCRNLASEIVTTRPDKQEHLLTEMVPRTGWKRAWAGDKTMWISLNQENNTSRAGSNSSNGESNSTSVVAQRPTAADDRNTTTSDNKTEFRFDQFEGKDPCAAIDDQKHLLREDCRQPLNFMCRAKTRVVQIDFACDEPGTIENGDLEAEGRVNGVNVRGTVITFSCRPLHYLVGSKTIQCLNTSEWDHKKPVCVKATACQEPPKIKNGAYKVLPAIDARSISVARSAPLPARAAARGRSASKPVSSPSTTAAPTPKAPKVAYPTGYHPPGTRTQFNCESRYYNLIGSGTRTCASNGEWSGRQPTCQPVCGTSSSPRSPFVVNGQASKVGQWPWQVGIAREVELADSDPTDPKYGWFLICGATLLTESWVVTAAHCVTVDKTTSLLPTDSLRLYFGKYHRNDSLDDEPVRISKVEEIHVHYDFNPVVYDSDIALIRLSEPVKLSSRIQPACLPDAINGMSDRHLQPGNMGVITGWGEDEKGDYAETLLQADIAVVSSKECEQGYLDAQIRLSVTPNMFCAGSGKGSPADSCTGDSGGPFVVAEGTGILERWFLEGIVSWGSPLGCGEDKQYGGYTKVSAFLDWIQMFI